MYCGRKECLDALEKSVYNIKDISLNWLTDTSVSERIERLLHFVRIIPNKNISKDEAKKKRDYNDLIKNLNEDYERTKIIVGIFPDILCDLSSKLRNDKELVKIALKKKVSNSNNKYKFSLKNIGEDLKNDLEIVERFLEFDINDFKYVDDDIKNNKEFVLKVIEKCPNNLQYVSEYLSDDMDVVLKAVNKDGLTLEYASVILKDDEKIVLAAISSDGLAIQYASERLKNNKEIVKKAINKDPSAFEYVGEALKRDKDIAQIAVNKDERMLQYVCPELEDYKTFVLEFLSKNDRLLEYVNEDVFKKKDSILIILKKSGSALSYTDEALKDDKDVVLTAVKQDGLALEYANPRLKKDKEIVIASIEQNFKAIRYADEKFKCDKDFILPYIEKEGLIINYIPFSMRSDEEILMAGVNQIAGRLKVKNYSEKYSTQGIMNRTPKLGFIYNYLKKSHTYNGKDGYLRGEIWNYKDGLIEYIVPITNDLEKAICKLIGRVTTKKIRLAAVPPSSIGKHSSVRDSIKIIVSRNKKADNKFTNKNDETVELLDCGTELVRVTDMMPQHETGHRDETILKEKTAFVPLDNNLNDVTYIVLDDVTTTGNSLNVCERLIREKLGSGSSVLLLALAKTLPDICTEKES